LPPSAARESYSVSSSQSGIGVNSFIAHYTAKIRQDRCKQSCMDKEQDQSRPTHDSCEIKGPPHSRKADDYIEKNHKFSLLCLPA